MTRSLLLILALLLPLVACGQDVLPNSNKPTVAEVKSAQEVVARAQANPIALAFGGYAFIEIDVTVKYKWYPVTGGIGELDQEVLPKGTVYKGFLVGKGDTAFKFTVVPKSDKDRVKITGTKEGPVTLLRIGPTIDDEPVAYHFMVGTQPLPIIVVPPVKPDGPVVPVVEKLGFVTMSINEWAKLPTSVKKHSVALADNYEAVAAQLAANSSMTIDAALALLTDKNRSTIGSDRAAMLPWFQAWASMAEKLGASGKLTTPADHVAAFNETATGLKRAR